MEAHIINVVRFAVCLLSLVTAIVAMVKADDNNAMRRLSAVLAGVLIYFNEQIGSMAYLTIGSTIEALMATAGVGFVLALAIVVMLFPFIFIIRWLTH
ncbi:MAG: hypothetical protein Q4F78_08480 [Bacillota bacterium]|nr:hypothetical protein [Bacillota bacterium]